MPRACTTCAHPQRAIIDGMIADKIPYLQIATKFGLNQRSVNTHGKNHVEPFMGEVEMQAQATVLARVMTYRDEVNLPLPEKSKYVENKLWDDYYSSKNLIERVAVIRELSKQQGEQAKLTGAYTAEKKNPSDISNIAKSVANRLMQERNLSEADAWAAVAKIYPDAVEASSAVH